MEVYSNSRKYEKKLLKKESIFFEDIFIKNKNISKKDAKNR